MKKIKLLTLFLLLTGSNLWAQDTNESSTFKPTVEFNGFAQLFFSVTQSDLDEDPYGFTLRILRFTPNGQLTEKIKWGFQLGFDKQQFTLFDVFIDFKIDEAFSIKAGQFGAPGARSGAYSDNLFSTTSMNMIERSTITQNWAGNSGLLGYRAFGLQLHGTFAEKKIYYAIMAHNPVATSIFTPSIKNNTHSHADNGLGITGRLEYSPFEGMAFGGFYATSTAKNYNSNTLVFDQTDRSSYGVHFTYRKDELSMMTEYIAGEVNNEKYNGFYAEATYHFKEKIGPALRYEYYTPNDGKPDDSNLIQTNNITLGLNYFPAKNVKLQANYVLKSEDMETGFNEFENNIFYIHLQYTFNTKNK